MNRRLYGTRFTTGCGHSWRRRRPRWTVADLAGATTDCVQCGEELIIPGAQFLGQSLDGFPAAVHAPLFHRYLRSQDPEWPEDGQGTGCVEFDVDDNEGQT